MSSPSESETGDERIETRETGRIPGAVLDEDLERRQPEIQWTSRDRPDRARPRVVTREEGEAYDGSGLDADGEPGHLAGLPA